MAGQESIATPAELLERAKMVRRQVREGFLEQAKYGYSKLAAKWPNHPRTLHVRALVEWSAGNRAAAERSIIEALGMDPHNAAVVGDYSDILWHTGREENAVRLMTDFQASHPTDPEPLRQLAKLYQRGLNAPAAAKYIRMLGELNPTDVVSLFMLAQRELDLRRYETAIERFSQALVYVEQEHEAHQNLLFAKLYHGTDPIEIRRTAEHASLAAFGKLPRTKLPARNVAGSRIRVGYVSGDLYSHVVPNFLLGLLREHDRDAFEIFIYSNTEKFDAISQRFIDLVGRDHFRNIASMENLAAANRIRADGIDVLIDVGGHTDSARLSVFAMRSAPVQATYLGYPATTGLPEMDYRITDAVADPPGITDEHYTERVYRLPRCAWAFEPIPPMISDEELEKLEPPAFRQAEGFFTFGSFNLLNKVNHASVRLWAKSIRAAQDAGLKARMLMTDRRGLLNDPESVELLANEYVQGGADGTRILLASWVPDTRAQFARLTEVDVMLDPLSYNGTTTTCEAIWNGVPVLTLPGKSHVSRVGASLMSAVGLQDFIVENEEAFIARAVELVNNPEPLRELRRSLRKRAKSSDLGNSKTLARAMEDAFVNMLNEKSGASAQNPK
jgi:predicted O-linked N-acetylglucosamine transferase (SPINDLY family)